MPLCKAISPSHLVSIKGIMVEGCLSVLMMILTLPLQIYEHLEYLPHLIYAVLMHQRLTPLSGLAPHGRNVQDDA
jgi:hypothetical protein